MTNEQTVATGAVFNIKSPKPDEMKILSFSNRKGEKPLPLSNAFGVGC